MTKLQQLWGKCKRIDLDGLVDYSNVVKVIMEMNVKGKKGLERLKKWWIGKIKCNMKMTGVKGSKSTEGDWSRWGCYMR